MKNVLGAHAETAADWQETWRQAVQFANQKGRGIRQEGGWHGQDQELV